MMRSVPMNTNAAGNKGLLELKSQKGAEHKEMRQIIVGEEGQGFSKENGSRSSELSGSVRHASKGITFDGLQKQQQQPKSQAVSWERFLPLRSLKVLLVENDDSTRHVVSALLRNCNYEVTAVSNGIQAWKILRDLPNHIDLVLTEVVIPCLSGIGLLGKIMSHKSCKIIPVIMMSSNDSMGIVFKCLSDGAVDFLVKPVRKNELKNLWQHVWRKCQSSSDSGSESGIHIQKDSKASFKECNNDTSSKNEEDNESIGMSARHGTGSQQNSSENGDAPVLRSPPTRKEIEVDSPKPVLQFTQLVDRVNSTCDQAIHPNPEAVSNECEPVTATDCLEQDKRLLDDVAMGKDLEIGVPGVQVLQNEYPSANDSTGLICTKKDKLLGLEPGRGDELASGHLNSVSPIGELSAQAAVLTGLVLNSTIPIETIISDASNGLTRIAEVKDKYIPDSKETTSFQLSLTRLRGAGDVSAATSDDKNTRRNTDISAFSRYNTTSTTNQAPTGIIGSCSPINSSSVAEKTNSMNNFPPDSNSSHPIHQPSSSSNNDMGSSTKNALSWTEASNGKSAPISTTKHINPSSPHRPIQNNHVYPFQQVISQNANNETVNMELEEPIREQQQVQIQHHHHHYHHYHHHVHNTEQQVPPPDDDDLSLKNITGASPQCGSTNVFGGSFEANAGKRSFNGSGSGSNQGSNGQNGSNTAENAGGVNIESYNNVAGRSGGCGSTGDGSGGSGSNQGSNGQNGSYTAVNAGGVNIESYNNVAGRSGGCGSTGDGSGGSGSNQGSNGQNGSYTAVNAGGVNIENYNNVARRSGGCGSTGDGSGEEMNQFSMEADLTKFCQKRKDRSFEKVQSESRRKLTEERPRIRGQLVQPTAYKQGSPDSDC